MTAETNIKRENECRFHPDCEGCRLDILHNGFSKSCYELTEQETEEALKEGAKND